MCNLGCLAQGQWDAAAESAEAKLLATYGDLLVARGQPEWARDQYEAALAILRTLGEVPYTERIERAMAEMSQH